MPSPTRLLRPPAQSTLSPPQVWIVGGGFGGLYTALYLYRRCRQARQPCQITLVEPRDRFLFTPLLYELLTDELQPWEIAPSYATLLRGTAIRHWQTAVTAVDLTAQQLTVATQEIVSYDYLVMALGSRDRPLPIPGWAEYALSFRTLTDVERLNARLAELETQGTQPIGIAIVGGGPSGVELACTLADRLGHRGQVHLMERGGRILKSFSESVRRVAMRSLAQRRVTLWLNTEVMEIEPGTLHMRRSTDLVTLRTHVVIGVAGAQPQKWPGSQAPVPLTPNGVPLNRPTLQLSQYPEVFVVGDQATLPWHRDRPAPQTAQAAYQAAAAVAHNLLAAMQRRSPCPFRYTHLGDMMTLGYQDALVAAAGLVIQGKWADLVRKVAYTYRLPPGGGHRWRVIRYRLNRLWHALFP